MIKFDWIGRELVDDDVQLAELFMPAALSCKDTSRLEGLNFVSFRAISCGKLSILLPFALDNWLVLEPSCMGRSDLKTLNHA